MNAAKFAAVVDAGVEVGNAVAGVLPTHRQCSVEITNECPNYTLHDASVYTSSGGCSDYTPNIASLTSGSLLFCKTPHTARGSVGVITYKLLNNSTKKSSKKIAVMFSVPYDFNLYSNWFAVGIFDKYKQCDYDLYCKMYYETDIAFKRGKAKDGRLTYEGNEVTIVARMTDTYQPVIKVQVSKK